MTHVFIVDEIIFMYHLEYMLTNRMMQQGVGYISIELANNQFELNKLN